jgi:drug/metabolite transporter (DMT)-like permease
VRHPVVLFVYVAIAVMWGSTWLLVRIGLRDLPPFLFAGLRMILAVAFLAPFALRGGGLGVLLRARGQVVLIGLFQVAIPYGLLFLAQQWVPSGLAAILFATFPIWIALVSRWFLPGERLTPLRVTSVLVGIAGVAVLEAPSLRDLSGSGLLAVGSATVVAASIVVAFANVLARRHILSLPPVGLTAGQSLVGGVVLLAVSLATEGGRTATFTPEAVGALVYLAIFGSGLTYLGLYWLLPRVPLAAVGMIPLLDTTVAVFLGAAVLGEPVGVSTAVGGAMVLLAAGLAGWRRASGDQLTVNRGASAQSPSRS